MVKEVLETKTTRRPRALPAPGRLVFKRSGAFGSVRLAFGGVRFLFSAFSFTPEGGFLFTLFSYLSLSLAFSLSLLGIYYVYPFSLYSL